MTISIQLDDDDLDYSNGQWTLITGLDAYQQRVRANLQTFQGEWFLDPALGVPYFQEIYDKKDPDLGVLNSIFTDALLNTNGTESILKLQFEQDNATRDLFVTFDVQSEDGLLTETLQV